MKALMIFLGMLLIAGSLVGQNANSRYPEDTTVEAARGRAESRQEAGQAQLVGGSKSFWQTTEKGQRSANGIPSRS